MIDEADEAMPGQSTGRKRPAADSPAASPRPNKRRPGWRIDSDLRHLSIYSASVWSSLVFSKLTRSSENVLMLRISDQLRYLLSNRNSVSYGLCMLYLM